MADRTDLLERILERLRDDLQNWIECACVMRFDAWEETFPVPGSVDPSSWPFIESLIRLVREIEAEIGRFEQHENPQWLDDLIDGKWNPEQADG